MSETLVVLAAGRARRYGGCKPLAPVGPSGEPVLDLLASDALAAGFSRIVVVVGPVTGAAIRYHVQRCWPDSVDVRFATQQTPLGTVHAVLAAAGHLDPGRAFAVANADDLYGVAAFEVIVDHLEHEDPSNALVGFPIHAVMLGDSPVTRGICEVGDDGYLISISERREVFTLGPGLGYASKDGLDPVEIDPDALVSMNLWAFNEEMWDVLGDAMLRSSDASQDAEVLLPDVVAKQLELGASGRGSSATKFKVLRTDSTCVGVTHPGDLALVQDEIARMVANGDRPAELWRRSG
ncbi:MAG: NTP transferase domain-containing protein [Actinobacteria bacterium]|nr:NTP transferase domain-containing protein [Actinomycetota bacterium]MCL5444768.1 NTP transferase domain-containing protein [Actinomycetota bacterium]